MKKFAINAVAVAAGAMAAGVALAGTVSVTGGATKYAVEAITASTAVTLPNYVYTMGVGRPIGNGFTILVTPSGGTTFGTCIVPTYTGASTVSVTLKRSSATECAYDVQVAAAPVAVGDTFTWTAQTLATHPLATANTVSVSVNLKDPGETSQVDNAGPVSATVASSGQALTLTATQDTLTQADVNNASGPLFGFVLANDDVAATAKASFTINNNDSVVASRFKIADGVTAFDFATHGTSLTLSIPGNFSGLATAAGSFNVVFNGTTYNATVASGTATVVIPNTGFTAGNFGAQLATASFTSALNTSLGTSRTFGVSGVSDNAVGANQNVAGNASWWVWGANASQLMTPYFSTNTNFITRFSLLNTGATAVTYTAKCYAETGNAITNGAAVSGSLAGNATSVINAADVCTFGGVSRGAVIFTINAPIETVKGTYNLVEKVTGATSFLPLTRPYGQAQTNE